MKLKPKRNIQQEFLDFHLFGKGKDTGADTHMWYRGDILYYENSPSWRLVDGPKKKVLLVKHIGFHRKGDDPILKVLDYASVPELGVFSRYPNDWMPQGKDLNDRIRFIFLSQARDIVYEQLPKYGGDVLERKERNSLTKELDKVYAAYRHFDKVMGCGWGDMPSIYREQLDQEAQRRIDAYNDPRKVKARERSKARKIAMEALGQAA